MKSRWIYYFLAAGILLLSGLTACISTGTKAIPTTTIPATPTIAIQSSPTNIPSKELATPYAQEPAAGICASFDGEMVVINLYPDIPDPRCSKVRVDQKLKVVNQTEKTVEISIGSFSAKLEPGKATLIDFPFGEYLAPGVHQLQVTPCCSAELWLEVK
jgi:hypothetical protein